MSQVITDAFSSYWQQCLIDQTPVVLDEFVLAHIPGLDPEAPIDPASGLPPAEQIVHRHAVDQRGRINNDAVAYSIVMDTTVGDFTFNAMYLINTSLNLVGMIVHKGEETKLRTDPSLGQTGNSLVKSMLMEYDRAAEASQTVIDASTWQIDYAARLRGMDEDLRRQAMGTFGRAAFYGDGFKLVNDAGLYKVQSGQGYVGGLLVELAAEQEVIPGAKPVGLWLDVYRAGSLLSPWVNHLTLTLSTSDLVDYVDASGYPHYVTQLATINADDSVTDTRARRTLTLSGDVTGQATFNGPDSIELEVHVEDNSHGHTIENVEGLQEALDGKAPTGHTHTPAEIGAAPAEMSKAFHTEVGSDGIRHAFVGADADGAGGSNGGSVIIASGESMDDARNNLPHDQERVYLVTDGELQILTGMQDGWGTHKTIVFKNDGQLYLVDGTKKVYNQGFKPTPAEIGAAPEVHGHAIEDVSGLEETLANKRGMRRVTLQAPEGAVAGTWYPVLVFVDGYLSGSPVYIGTRSSSGSDAMNYNGFSGTLAAGGWTDRGDEYSGEFFQHDPDEISISCIVGPTESSGAAAFYVEGSAFPVVVESVESLPPPVTGASITHGTSTFTASTTPHAGAGTKVRLIAPLDEGSGFYSARQGRLYGSNSKPTAAEGNSDIVAGSYGQVGTYVLAQAINMNGMTIGATIAGSNLRPVAMDVGNWDISTSGLSGTWKILGHNDSGRDMMSLYIRIA